jgi:hypothetical protein
MSKCLAAVAGTVAILSAALFTPAQAGGGATSAASKYGHSSQVVTNQTRTARPTDQVARGEVSLIREGF